MATKNVADRTEVPISKLSEIASGAIGLLAFMALWQAGSAFNSNLPAPIESFRALIEISQDSSFIPNAAASFLRVLAGFFVALILGGAIFLISYAVPAFRIAVSAPTDLLRPIPPIAWIPLSIALLGLSNASSVLIIFLGAFFPLHTALMHGLLIDAPPFLSMAEALGAGRAKQIVQVLIPASLPALFSGTKIAVGFAWMCVVVAEMSYARSGLGYALQLERQLLAMDKVVAYMGVIGLIGYALTGLASLLERSLTSWRTESETEDESIPPLLKRMEPPRVAIAPELAGPAVEIDHVSFRYDSEKAVLDNVNISVTEGEIVAIVGASGNGKTTLLRLIAGQLVPEEGKIKFHFGTRGAEPKVGWVFQAEGLFPWMSAIENVSFGLGADLAPADTDRRATFWLERVGLKDFSNRFPRALSGGQKQRVQLARCFASGASVILLDEPFSMLDAPTRKRLIREFRLYLHAARITVFFVTHDLNDAMDLADRVISLKQGTVGASNGLEVSMAQRDNLTEARNSVPAETVNALWKEIEGRAQG